MESVVQQQLTKWAISLPETSEQELLFKLDTLLSIQRGEYKTWDIYKKLVNRLAPVHNKRYNPIKKSGSKSSPGKYNNSISIYEIAPKHVWDNHKRIQNEVFKKHPDKELLNRLVEQK
jgi:hypothetical protein